MHPTQTSYKIAAGKEHSQPCTINTTYDLYLAIQLNGSLFPPYTCWILRMHFRVRQVAELLTNWGKKVHHFAFHTDPSGRFEVHIHFFIIDKT